MSIPGRAAIRGFPFICSTYRVSEHWQTGVLTRWCPWLVGNAARDVRGDEPELAEGKRNHCQRREGDRQIAPAAKLEATAIVTARFKPFDIDGTTIHEVGIPWHFGWITTADRKYNPGDKKAGSLHHRDSANLLTPTIGDANTMIPESKAFMVNVVKKKGVK